VLDAHPHLRELSAHTRTHVSVSEALMAFPSRNRHIFAMTTKKHPSTCITVGRDAKTGRMIPAGYGALKGQYVVREGVDGTKPIFEQV
jgi:hypothetical protein